MSNTTKKIYEALFLLPQSSGADLGNAAELVKGILQKVEAELISFRKWDERRLAYEIKGNKRGLYFLCYFRMAGEQVSALDRQCFLSDDVLRHMVTRADHLTMEQMQAADGAQELADEIKLRAEQAQDRTSAATAIIDRTDANAEGGSAPASEDAPSKPEADAGDSSEPVAAEAAPSGDSA